MGRTMRVSAAAAVLVAALAAGCGGSGATRTPLLAAAKPTCDGLAATYRTKGDALLGDLDRDGSIDRVTLRVDRTRPRACRHLLVAEIGPGRTVATAVKPLPWFGTNPRLLLLAEIDGRGGLEPVVALSPDAVYRPGAVFAMRKGRLVRLRLDGTRPSDLFPFEDEFPSGVDCAGKPGKIVVTFGDVGDPDSHWDIKRSVYRAAGIRFERVRTKRFRIEVGPEASRRWPEVRGDPFRSCPDRVD
jgi:hypothetical protein